MISSDLFTDVLYQHSLPASPVELAIEDPLPGTKVESAVGHRDDHLAAHDLPLQVGVGVIFARPVVLILTNRRVRCQPFEPHLIIVVQATLVVVDKHTRSNVYRR